MNIKVLIETSYKIDWQDETVKAILDTKESRRELIEDFYGYDDEDIDEDEEFIEFISGKTNIIEQLKDYGDWDDADGHSFEIITFEEYEQRLLKQIDEIRKEIEKLK